MKRLIVKVFLSQLYISVCLLGCSPKESTIVQKDKLNGVKGKRTMIIIRADRYVGGGELDGKKVVIKEVKGIRQVKTSGFGHVANDAPVIATIFSLSVMDDLQKTLSRFFLTVDLSDEEYSSAAPSQLVFHDDHVLIYPQGIKSISLNDGTLSKIISEYSIEAIAVIDLHWSFFQKSIKYIYCNPKLTILDKNLSIVYKTEGGMETKARYVSILTDVLNQLETDLDKIISYVQLRKGKDFTQRILPQELQKALSDISINLSKNLQKRIKLTLQESSK